MKRFAGIRAAAPVAFGILLFAALIVWLVLALGYASQVSDEERLLQVKQ